MRTLCQSYQTIFQSLNPFAVVISFLAQQSSIQGNQFQIRFWCCVIVAFLIGQVVFRYFVHTAQDIRHKYGD